MFGIRSCYARKLIAFASIGALLFLFYPHTEVRANSIPAPAWLGVEGAEDEVDVENESNDTSTGAFTTNETIPEDAEPYQQTFIISAYYSPLEGQRRYATGSLASDIRLNGSGVNGADGTPVYPGMIAAPKKYPFGTKMNIPGVGVVAVHDRGGAIVSTGVRGNAYDRLDIWMGYGDEGLNRALQWGKRTVDVTVYGINPAILEQVEFPVSAPPSSVGTTTVQQAPEPVVTRQLAVGSEGDDVKKLQQLLIDLNYYKGEATAYFDEATRQAVAAFQVANSIISSHESYGAGHVGPQTRKILAQVVPEAAAQSKEESIKEIDTFTVDLKRGDSGEQVRALQEELRRINLFGIDPTGQYGEVTEHAVFKFQQTQKLAGDESSAGAGIFGPKTREALNELVAARLRTERVSIQHAT